MDSRPSPVASSSCQALPGVGTTAELWLPATDEVPASDVPLQAPASALARRLVVLVVDDDSLVLASTVAMLEELGHTALGASSAAEALESLRNGQAVHLLITDQAMPQMTGEQLIELVRHEHPALPAILATGYAELGSELPPSIGRLNKPFGQQALAAAVAAIDGHRVSRQAGSEANRIAPPITGAGSSTAVGKPRSAP
jgi:CheY-like chemotaxis protein